MLQVNLGNLSGGLCVPGRETSTDSLPITIRNDDSYYSNNAHPTAMVDGRSFVQYDAPNVQQNNATFLPQNIVTFPQQNIALFPQHGSLFNQQDHAAPTPLERENNWKDIELTIKEDLTLSEADDNIDVMLLDMLKKATPCSPDPFNELNGELAPLEIYVGPNCPGVMTPRQNPSMENSPLSQTGSSPTQFNQSPTIDRVGNEWSLPNFDLFSFPENSPISLGSPGYLYSSNDWNQRNGDSSSFSSLESPPISVNDDYVLKKQVLEIDVNTVYAGIVSDTILEGNCYQNQLHTLVSEESFNIDSLISSGAVSSIQQIQRELKASQVNAARPCQRCHYDTRNATDVLCEQYGNLDWDDRKNIVRNVHRYDEAKVLM